MSDREGASGVPPIDDELSLPKATVAKMINGACMFWNCLKLHIHYASSILLLLYHTAVC